MQIGATSEGVGGMAHPAVRMGNVSDLGDDERLRRAVQNARSTRSRGYVPRWERLPYMAAGKVVSVFAMLALAACGGAESANSRQAQANIASTHEAPHPAAQPQSLASCYDVNKSEPEKLVGRLDHVVFPGPPNYEDVRNGDMPEPTYILRLHRPICITDGDDGFADPNHSFTDVHVVAGKMKSSELRRFLGQNVEVSLYDQMGAQTGHHHAPLVAWVAGISPEAEQTASAPPQALPADYSKAAATVRGFYTALRTGDGATAAARVVSEKRLTGPLSVSALSSFYGSMKRPLELLDLVEIDAASYLVRYRYTVSKTACTGRAVVTTTLRNGESYIASIRALDGC